MKTILETLAAAAIGLSFALAFYIAGEMTEGRTPGETFRDLLQPQQNDSALRQTSARKY